MRLIFLYHLLDDSENRVLEPGFALHVSPYMKNVVLIGRPSLGAARRKVCDILAAI
jgi:hypothetical protein